MIVLNQSLGLFNNSVSYCLGTEVSKQFSLNNSIAKIILKRYHCCMINETIIEEVISERLAGFSEKKEKFSETRDVFTARMHRCFPLADYGKGVKQSLLSVLPSIAVV